MARCPKCQHYLTPMRIMTRPFVCPICYIKLGFNKKEYGHVARPGIFIALFLLFNLFYTVDYSMKVYINLALLVIWFIFFKRYIDYLKSAKLEDRSEGHE